MRIKGTLTDIFAVRTARAKSKEKVKALKGLASETKKLHESHGSAVEITEDFNRESKHPQVLFYCSCSRIK